MSEHILFLTGQLAERPLTRILNQMELQDCTWSVRQIGVKVAALMTAEMIQRRLTDTDGADWIMIPGRCRGDVDTLAAHFGIPVRRGPEDLADLPRHFGIDGPPADLDRFDVRIFAEIVDAPQLTVDEILETADRFAGEGADVIDLGCLPDTPFPHLAQAVEYLKEAGHRVSVDSMNPEDLLLAGRAGADYLLSLNEHNLWVAEQVDAVPVIIPHPQDDLASLERAIAGMQALGKPFIADPILDPIHFGFADSIVRYHALRRSHPDVEILMGVGNLTELTEADTAGVNAVLMGLISELGITNILATQVSPHCRTAIREADRARRIMYWARQENSLPKLIDDGLTGLHERMPYPYSAAEVRDLAAQIRDRSFRIQVTDEGIHVYNRDLLVTHQDPFDFYPDLGVEQDASHAFYLGVELARAQIAHQLGKRYVQDQELRWGCMVDPPEEDMSTYAAPASTKRKRVHRGDAE
jgi:dihydropteroate synthase-like protein